MSVWSLWDKQTRYLRVLILTWFIPLSVYLLFFSHFKYQYWLPVAIPLFSNLAYLIPKKINKPFDKRLIINFLLIGIVLVQFVLFVQRDIELFTVRTNREENSQAIKFYENRCKPWT